jgi:hypothetical protein
MANLIITVIAIALVAVASLMGAYYGGSAFLNAQANANAATLMNAGQQLAGAFQSYLVNNQNTPPTSWASLISGGYIQKILVFPNLGSNSQGTLMGISVDGSGTYWLWGDINAVTTTSPTDPNGAVCQDIIKAATGSKLTTTIPTGGVNHAQLTGSAGTGNGNGTFGCEINNASENDPSASNVMPDNPGEVPNNHYAFFYRLN